MPENFFELAEPRTEYHCIQAIQNLIGYDGRRNVIMKKLIPVIIASLVLLMVVPANAEQIVVEPGYIVEVFVTGLETINDLILNKSGDLLVSETSEERVLIIDVLPNGSAGEIEEYATGIPDAEGVALDAADVLYVSNSDTVFKVVEGMEIPFVAGFNDAEGLAIDQSGDLFVADDVSGGVRISKIDILEDGSAGGITTFAIIPSGHAADIEFDGNGDLFVANGQNQVWIVDILPDGMVYEIRPFIGDLSSPFALEFDNKGNLFVGGSNGDIWKVNSDGEVTQFGSGFAGVEGLAFDARGNLYASEYQAGRISKIIKVYEATIDIKPGSYPNSINCSNEKAVVTVAILTTGDFDATTVDHTTVTFEGASEIHVDKKTGVPQRHEEDVDFDGDMDLVFHFRLGDTTLTCESVAGTLIGETYDGLPVQGTDSIRRLH
jgi:sugar lactone lactonase YvrE